MCRVPNSARMLLPAEAQPQLRPTPLEPGWGDDEGMEKRKKEKKSRGGKFN